MFEISGGKKKIWRDGMSNITSVKKYQTEFKYWNKKKLRIDPIVNRNPRCVEILQKIFGEGKLSVYMKIENRFESNS